MKMKTVYQVGYLACAGTWLVSATGSTPREAKHALNNKLMLLRKVHEDYKDYEYEESSFEEFSHE